MPTDHSTYDAVILLCGGLYKDEQGFPPTTYEHGDEFGMLGGAMRVTAALALYKQGAARTFVFSSGLSAKHIAKYGPDTPPDAHVYGEAFLQQLHADRHPVVHPAAALAEPEVLYEAESVNTVHNVIEVAKMTTEAGWKHIAVLSSGYHIPRITALYEMIHETRPELLSSATIEFLSAEAVVQAAYPGTYDAVIAAAHATPAAKLRLQNEATGLAAIEGGHYKLQEFQTTK